jgi:hypothetical protein
MSGNSKWTDFGTDTLELGSSIIRDNGTVIVGVCACLCVGVCVM